jgi:hypothetical protein
LGETTEVSTSAFVFVKQSPVSIKKIGLKKRGGGEKLVKVETRSSEVITIRVGSHYIPIPTGDETKVVRSDETETEISTA